MAATERLSDTPDNVADQWRIPALIGLGALALLAALGILRLFLAKRRSDDDDEPDTPADFGGPEGPVNG